ncbi:MAG TPA: phage tail length tape measure family protein [Mizugakiibacter sp.]
MAGNVRDYELLLKVRADLQQAVGGLGQLSKSLRDLDKTGAAGFKNIEASLGRIGTLAGSLKGALAAAGVGLAFKTIIDNAVEAENNARQLEQRLKSTGGAAGLTKDQLLNLADGLQGLTTFEDDAIVGAENLLLTFKNIKGPVFQQATEAVLDMSTALGQDLKSSAVQLGKALNDPVQGISALSRSGITFTADQQKVIKALVETGRTAEAQRLILREISSEMGGSARAAAETFGGALAQVKNAFGNLLEGNGAGLKDAAGSLRDLRDTLNSPNVQQGFANLVEGAVRAVGAIAKLTSWVTNLAQSTGEFFGRLASGGIDADNSLAATQKRLADVNGELARVRELTSGQRGTGELSFLDAGIIDAANKLKGGTLEERLRQYQQLLEIRQKLLQNAAQAESSKPEPVVVEPPSYGRLPTLTVTPGTPTAEDPEAAAKRVSAQAEAFKRLQDVINGLRGDVGGPAEKAWQDYAAAVQKAAEAGGDAIRNGANVADVQTQVAEAVTLAAQKREQSLKALSDQARKAYEQLRQELRTPAEAATETAQARIKVLDDALRKGIIDAKAYREEIARVGTNSVQQAPQYQGVDAAVAGVGGELAKNFEAQRALEEWHAQQLAANEAFRQQDTANEAVYQSRLAEIQRQYAEQRQKIEVSRQQLTLQASSDFFGQLAVLSRSNNSKIAAIGKTAAIAKAIIDTYQSANAAYAALASIPYIGPALGAAAAGAAIAAGLANVAQIRSQQTAFATGGLVSGPGTGTSDSIPARLSNGEFVQRTAAVRYYGVDFMDAVNNLQFPRYADGGLVGNTEGLTGVRTPAALPASGGAAPQVNNHLRVMNFVDPDALAQELSKTGAFEKAVVNAVVANSGAVKQGLGS